ncbi:ABC-type nitrate/sulfonate/bicarbonate transport system substrate-binding protein [Flavimobilis soli]|uniref:ABC-type nitrate/sulfonate/bicarbonate transport system substrate-binding protein n=1 Tax=Flavimobilis soli TaxID=442709 RepID=A0A2A9EE09_9MICO|nr:ABC transporter substrate-binding protein [Flavimobilis soli]PFG37154.1 ABC-type nitrate/sulfonate/bicarbonate transport system substrate-binding protein [Flavimobilis soli]
MTATTARPRRRAAAALAALLALPAALAACGTAQADAGAADGTTVLRYQGSVGQVTFPELAEDLGYFEKVSLEWIGDVTGGPASIQAVATGQADIGNAFNGAIIKLVDSGAPIKAVLASYGSDSLTNGGVYVLEDSPITTARDLIGKKIAVNTLGAQAEAVDRSWLKQEGLTPEEIAQVELTVVPPVNAEQTLREGQVDAAGLSGPLQDLALERGGIRKLFSEVDLFGELSYGSYVLPTSLIEKNPDAAADFVQGTARAIRWAQVTPPEEVRERYTSIITERGRGENTDLVAFYKSSSVAGAGGVVADDEINLWIDWLVEDGQIEPGITTADVVTNDLNPYANGTYAPDAGPDGKPVD